MTLTELFTNIANAIRSKTGSSASIKAEDFPSAISGISVGVEGGIIPTGVKSITTNGTHDVTSYASAEVNVPVGVSPTGTKTITSNGTHDVTNFATANVNVPTPIQIAETRTITIGADQGNGTASTLTVLTGDPFIKEHYSKVGLSITLIPLDTAVAEATVCSFIWHGNRSVSNGKQSYYGTALQTPGTSGAPVGVINSAPLTGTTYTVGFRINSSGNVILYTRAASMIKAGSYLLVLTCTE